MHVVRNRLQESSRPQLQDSLLGISLAAAVPLWIPRVARLSHAERAARAGELAQVIAEHGDDVLYRGHKSGDSARAFNAVAEALAIGAFQPGGVTAFGEHFCTDHGRCERASQAAAEDAGPGAAADLASLPDAEPADVLEL